MIHNSLEDHIQLMFTLEHEHKYLTSEIDNWIVFEKDVRVDMLIQKMEQKKILEQSE